MKVSIIDYTPEHDDELLRLFYQSVYGIPTYKQAKGSDYVRIPHNWIYRYKLSKESITKVAIKDNEIIGSLGVAIRTGKINNRTGKIGCYVDNCIRLKH